MEHLYHHHDDVHLIKGPLGRCHHALMEGGSGLVNAWCVQKDHLVSIAMINPQYAISSGLGLWGYNGHLFPEQSVQKGRFPHIGWPYDCYKTG